MTDVAAKDQLAEWRVQVEQQISMARGWMTGNDFKARKLIAALEAVLAMCQRHESDYYLETFVDDLRETIAEALGAPDDH